MAHHHRGEGATEASPLRGHPCRHHKRKADEAEIENLPFYDPQLPNRRLSQTGAKGIGGVRQSQRGGDPFIDLDDFKT
jgi:hypothetical protein